MRISEIFGCNNVIPVVLAPMAGVTDLAYRIVCHSNGCDFSYSEMVSASGLSYENKNTKKLLASAKDAVPFGIQIFGHDPDVIYKTVCGLSFCADASPSLIDINMGCPAPKIVTNGDGSALMKDLGRARAIISAATSASADANLGLPITVKMRSGWDEGSINAPQLAVIAQECGASAVAVHGRTRVMMYSGQADLNVIRNVKNTVTIPVIGNGDLFSGDDALKMLEATKCDAVMIGRAAEGNPFIFREIRAKLDGVEYTKQSLQETYDALCAHITLHASIKGERAFPELRKHIAWYTKSMRGGSAFRREVNSAKDYDELLRLVNNFFE